jgi:hypothetical protein
MKLYKKKKTLHHITMNILTKGNVLYQPLPFHYIYFYYYYYSTQLITLYCIGQILIVECNST